MGFNIHEAYEELIIGPHRQGRSSKKRKRRATERKRFQGIFNLRVPYQPKPSVNGARLSYNSQSVGIAIECFICINVHKRIEIA